MPKLIKGDGLYLTAEELDNMKSVEKDGVTMFYLQCRDLKPTFDESQKKLVIEMITARKKKKEMLVALGISEYMFKKLLDQWFGTRSISKIYTEKLGLTYKYQRKKKPQEPTAKEMEAIKEEMEQHEEANLQQ